MARYSQTIINQLLEQSDNALNSDVKGDKLEKLVVYLFQKVPGVTFYKKNILNGTRSHEIDVVFLNEKKSELHFLNYIIVTECKNTGTAVSSESVGWFVRKLQDMGMFYGILISLNGITGARDGINHAHSEIITAVIRDKIKVLVITREEICNFQTTNDLVELLKEKILKLTLERTVL